MKKPGSWRGLSLKGQRMVGGSLKRSDFDCRKGKQGKEESYIYPEVRGIDCKENWFWEEWIKRNWLVRELRRRELNICWGEGEKGSASTIADLNMIWRGGWPQDLLNNRRQSMLWGEKKYLRTPAGNMPLCIQRKVEKAPQQEVVVITFVFRVKGPSQLASPPLPAPSKKKKSQNLWIYGGTGLEHWNIALIKGMKPY